VPDRLEDLLRQRALLRERLESLDREISEIGGSDEFPSADAPPFLGGFPRDEGLAENILEKYRREGALDPNQAKRGCLLYFTVAIGLLFLGLGAMYLYERSHLGR
jgi:hypothetical protein